GRLAGESSVGATSSGRAAPESAAQPGLRRNGEPDGPSGLGGCPRTAPGQEQSMPVRRKEDQPGSPVGQRRDRPISGFPGYSVIHSQWNDAQGHGELGETSAAAR